MTNIKNAVFLPVLAGAMILGGGLAGYATLAAAQDATTGGVQGAQTAPSGFDHKMGGHIGSNGSKEELLTGDTATKVTAAALAAQPGATIDRVETDAEGAAYEAHITTADGSHKTLKFDTAFNVTATEDGSSSR